MHPFIGNKEMILPDRVNTPVLVFIPEKNEKPVVVSHWDPVVDGVVSTPSPGDLHVPGCALGFVSALSAEVPGGSWN